MTIIIALYALCGLPAGRYWARSEYYNLGFLAKKGRKDGPGGAPLLAFCCGWFIWPIALFVWLGCRMETQGVRLLAGKPPKEYEKKRLAKMTEEYEAEERENSA